MAVLVLLCAVPFASQREFPGVVFADEANQQNSGKAVDSIHKPLVFVVRLENEAITPITARFLRRTFQQAEQERAQCVIVALDTPGGLVESTREIVSEILASRTCIVVYVAPSGARAASAGMYITLAAHVAAMAPTTRIGAAHPVQIGGLPFLPQPTPTEDEKDKTEEKKEQPAEKPASPMEEKIVNDTVAWARSLAELRGRNAPWAERAVKESIVATDSEALDENVIDLVAKNIPELLEKINGRKVELPQGAITLSTADVDEVRALEMWWGERFLGIISTPNVAFLLLMFGFYGIIFEFYSPGWGVAGTLGIICLVLAFFGLAVLPINFVGLVLILLALGLFAAEVFVTSYGALGIGGMVCLIMGALMLVDSPVGFLRISLAVIIPVAAATAAIIIFLISSVVKAHRARVQTGGEGLIGTKAVVFDQFSKTDDGFAGTVQVHGEFWNAVCPTPVSPGDIVLVRNREGLTLSVEESAVATEPAIQ